jgi:hypothetical protein
MGLLAFAVLCATNYEASTTAAFLVVISTTIKSSFIYGFSLSLKKNLHRDQRENHVLFPDDALIYLH